MDKDPTANREFAELANRFQFFEHDSKDTRTDVTKKYSFKYSHTGFLFLGNKADEFARIENALSFDFDDSIIQRIQKIENEYWQTQSSLVEYLDSMLKSTKTDSEELSLLVQQLASDKFEVRQDAENRLMQFGSCSHSFLTNAKPDKPESRQRIKRILERLDPLKEKILQYDLTRNVPFLARHFEAYPNIETRLQSLLPDVDPAAAELWWQEHGDEYQWDRDTDRYIPVQD